jgi:hypothetical protein
MMRTVLALLLMLSLPEGAFAQDGDCLVSFPLQESSGDFGALTLYNFGGHMELQAETPKQEYLQDFTLAIDGKPAAVFPSPGLDDLLVVLSTAEADLEVSDVLLSALTEGRQAVLTATTGTGQKTTAKYRLDSGASKISTVKAGCK